MLFRQVPADTQYALTYHLVTVKASFAGSLSKRSTVYSSDKTYMKNRKGHVQSGPKLALFLYVLTLLNINRFSELFLLSESGENL